MTQVIRRNFIVLISVAIAALIMSIAPTVRAQEAGDGVKIEGSTEQETQGDNEATVEEATEGESATDANANDAYAFVAQSGDSYTKIARKAVQIYGFDNTVELSGAQIVFIETNLTLAANSPELTVGEQVTVNKALIGEWVEKAKALTDEQKAAWQVYADRVDFNTDNVGEARQ